MGRVIHVRRPRAVPMIAPWNACPVLVGAWAMPFRIVLSEVRGKMGFHVRVNNGVSKGNLVLQRVLVSGVETVPRMKAKAAMMVIWARAPHSHRGYCHPPILAIAMQLIVNYSAGLLS